MASPKSDIPPKTSLALRKATGTAPRTMASGDAHTADTTAPSTTAPDAVPSIFGPHSPVTPAANSQTNCPIFSLAKELRDMIYEYAFTPTLEAPVNGNPLPIKLNALPTIVPSSAFLLTCHQAEQDAVVIFRAAQRSFWNDNTTFSINLNDDWESEDARKGRHFEVLDLLDEASLFPELSDDQVNAMRRLIISVKSDIGNFKIRLVERRHLNTKYWVLNRTTSALPSSALRGGAVADSNQFKCTLLEVFRGRASRVQGNGQYLFQAESYFMRLRTFATASSGRRYLRSAYEEMKAKLAARRAVVAAKPPSAPNSVKKRQLDALLEHCWLVYRARRTV